MSLIDVAVIGAGPAGLNAVFHCGMLGLRCAVFDARVQVGGQCSALYPEKKVYDIPGFLSVTGAALAEALLLQAQPFEPAVFLGEEVVTVIRLGDSFEVRTLSGRCVNASAVILSTGSGLISPRKLPIAKLQEAEGKSVFYAVERMEDFRDQRVVVAGGGDSALDWALALAEVASKVTLVHRRAEFTCYPAKVEMLRALAARNQLELAPPSQIAGVIQKDGLISAVQVRTTAGDAISIAADSLLLFYGLQPQPTALASWGIVTEQHRARVDPATHMTNVTGVFAIGEATAYPNRINLISCSFAEAARAARGAYKYMSPHAALPLAHSSDRPPPSLAQAKA